MAAAAAAARAERDPAMLAQLAESMMQVRRADDAIRYLTRALSLVPGDPDLTTRLAIAEADAGHSASARARLDSVIARHPDYRPARDVRARLGGK
jgi:predicted Zn-dependent protease